MRSSIFTTMNVSGGGQSEDANETVILGRE
jgi:hypothetical protein